MLLNWAFATPALFLLSIFLHLLLFIVVFLLSFPHLFFIFLFLLVFLFLFVGLQLVVDSHLPEIVVCQQQGEASIAVAPWAEDVLILLFSQGRVLGVDAPHDGGYLFGVYHSQVLEPDNPAVDAAVVAEGPDRVGDFLQQLVVPHVLAEEGRLRGVSELMLEEFLFAGLQVSFEDIALMVGLLFVVVEVGVDDSDVGEEKVDLHQPVGVVADVLPHLPHRQVSPCRLALLLVQLHHDVAMPFVLIQESGEGWALDELR